MDNLSLLHFVFGFILYTCGIQLETWIIVHGLLELFFSSNTGQQVLLQYMPGFVNRYGYRTSDTLYGAFGWIAASYILQKN